jgi:dihydrofolate synthase / folylpolyglutamate synthase
VIACGSAFGRRRARRALLNLFCFAMNITPVKLQVLVPPKDNLLSKIKKSKLSLKNGDVIAISSKVVSIHEGRCILWKEGLKDKLIKRESALYIPKEDVPGEFVAHTITDGSFIPNAGIDPFGGYYILWPKNPQKSAEKLLAWFKKTYKCKKLYLVITDSRSVFLRRGVMGMSVAWAGFEPIFDNRVRRDLLGFRQGGSQTNIPDSIAAMAVFMMGEANEQTPLVRLRGVPYVGEKQVGHKKEFNTYKFSMEEDIFAPFLTKGGWRKGKG